MDVTQAFRALVMRHPDAAEVLGGVAAGLVVAAIAFVQGPRGSDLVFRVSTLGLALGILVYVTARRRRSQAERRAREALESRLALARELHDTVAHHVSLIGIQAAAVRRSVGATDPAIVEGLDSIEASSREAVRELGRMLAALRNASPPSDRRAQPGLAAVPSLVEEARSAGQVVDLSIVGVRPETMPEAVDTAAFRLVRESLTNARKHAGLAAVSVTIAYGPDELELIVANPLDGHEVRGTRGPVSGLGLAGMRERAALFGGELTAGSDGAERFVVRARIPYRASPVSSASGSGS